MLGTVAFSRSLPELSGQLPRAPRQPAHLLGCASVSSLAGGKRETREKNETMGQVSRSARHPQRLPRSPSFSPAPDPPPLACRNPSILIAPRSPYLGAVRCRGAEKEARAAAARRAVRCPGAEFNSNFLSWSHGGVEGVGLVSLGVGCEENLTSALPRPQFLCPLQGRSRMAMGGLRLFLKRAPDRPRGMVPATYLPAFPAWRMVRFHRLCCYL